MLSGADNRQVLPKGIQRIVIKDNRVLIRATPETIANGVTIQKGKAVVPLERINGDIRFNPAMLDLYKPDFAPPKPASKGPTKTFGRPAYWIGLNALQDWVIPGTSTLQASFSKPYAGNDISLQDPILLPPHKMPLQFSTKLAVHRAAADLVIIRKGTQFKTETRQRIPFDRDKTGGMLLEDYAAVSLNLAPSEHETALYLTLALRQYQDDGSGQPPFLFMSDPLVQSADPNIRANITYFAEAPAIKEHTIWASALVPAYCAPDVALELISNDTIITLAPGMGVQISIVEDHGHGLLMTASRLGTYRFLIDGKFSYSVQLGPEPTWVRHPHRVLNGTHRHLMITDATGVLSLFRTYLLMPSFLTSQEVLYKESRAPYPLRSGPMLFRRYDALKAQLASGLNADQQQQLTHALSTLEGGLKDTRLDPLNFKKPQTPLVSIVIPVLSPIQYIYRTLCSLILAHSSLDFEIILVDGRKSDTGTNLKAIATGVMVLKCPNSGGFIQASNKAVAAARGKYVTLLSDAAEVTTGWLDALVNGFERVENVGMVGSKLIDPDGNLLAAGHIAGKNGDLWRYGHGQNPWEPRFCYARQTDYLSSAALMTTRKIWDEVKGLSAGFAPLTCEDADLSFKIHAAGYNTWFIPDSVVALDETTFHGLVPDNKSNALRLASETEFKCRWNTAFNAFGSDSAHLDIEKDRGIIGQILFFDHATPRPDRDAGSYAALQEMRLIQSLGYKVVFMPRDLAEWGSYTKDLERMGVEVIRSPFFMSPDEYLLYHAADFDAFYITRFTVAETVLSTLRQVAPDTPVLLNNADLHFLREMRAALIADDPKKMADARKIRKRELAVMGKVDLVLSYTDIEHATIHTHATGQVKIRKCPWVVEMPDNPPPSIKKRAGLSFLGGYTHKPNAEAMLWFADQVTPALSRSHPDLCLYIYGANMPDEIRALAASTIIPAGYIENVADAYDRHLIFIVPLQSGAGIKGKVLAALAHGIPCILSPLAAEGIGARHGHECLVAGSPAEWGNAIVSILDDPSLWARLSKNGRALIDEMYSFEKGQVLMRDALGSVGLDVGLPQQTLAFAAPRS